MNKIVKIFLLFSFTTLAFGVFFYLKNNYSQIPNPKTQPLKNETKLVVGKAEPEEKSLPPPTTVIDLSSKTLKQGDALIVKIYDYYASSSLDFLPVKFGAKDFQLIKIGTTGKWLGIIGIDAKKKPGNYSLTLSLPDNQIFQKSITILPAGFSVTTLAVPPELKAKGETPKTLAQNITANDSAVLKESIKELTPKIYFDKPFVYPLEEIKNVGAYGSIRKSGAAEIQHLGIDLDAEIGTPVYAINDGIISFSRELPNYGKTMAINHGSGVYSIYLHLNSLDLPEGREVARGEIVARSGASGAYSFGPHLHFSIRVNGESVDPIKFQETINPILEKF